MAGRQLAIGDIHGCDFALESLLEMVAPTSADEVIILGDVVDRGGGSKQSLDLLLALRESTNLVFVRGNHEEMMLHAPFERQWREAWLQYGGSATLFSYGGAMDQVPAAHWDFLKSSIDYYDTPETLFVHANLEPGVTLENQSVQWLRWTHLSGLEVPLENGQRVICGHTPQKSGIPLVRPGWICVDTYACGNGWLTCLDVAAGIAYQSNEKKQRRQLDLSNAAKGTEHSDQPVT